MKKRIGKVRCIQEANAALREGPVCDSAHGVLLWVDIKRPAVFRWSLDQGQTGHWPMPKPVGCVAACESDRCIFADADGFGFLDLESGEIVRLVDPESDLPDNVFNDGKVDRMRRFWAGSMEANGVKPSGSLYRLDRDLSIHRLESGFTCLNGLGWSPDDRTMYVTDSVARTIWAYQFDVATGALGTRQAFAQLRSHDGLPDGLTVDQEGFVSSAIWDGRRLIRFAPDGAIDREVRIPVQRPTSCTFGGVDLRTLYVTSASDELTWSSLRRGQRAGALFAIDTEIAGSPATAFGGG
jgi:sugar lactone lactonase YvrE